MLSSKVLKHKSLRSSIQKELKISVILIKRKSKYLPSFLLLQPLAANWHLLLHLVRSKLYGFVPSLPPLKKKNIRFKIISFIFLNRQLYSTGSQKSLLQILCRSWTRTTELSVKHREQILLDFRNKCQNLDSNYNFTLYGCFPSSLSTSKLPKLTILLP